MRKTLRRELGQCLELTAPTSFRKSSTGDHCNCLPFVITTGVKVGRIPTISRDSVQQKLIAVGKAWCVLQPIHQSLPLTGRENHWILERLNYSRDWICWRRWFQLVYHSFNLIKSGLCQQLSANDLVIRDDELPRAQIIQDVTEVGSISINEVRSKPKIDSFVCDEWLLEPNPFRVKVSAAYALQVSSEICRLIVFLYSLFLSFSTSLTPLCKHFRLPKLKPLTLAFVTMFLDYVFNKTTKTFLTYRSSFNRHHFVIF